MNRLRLKVVGFGLTVLAGAAAAADGDWQPTGPVVGKGPSVRAAAAPGLLPASLRATPPAPAPTPVVAAAWAAPESDPVGNPIWLPSATPAGITPTVPPAGMPGVFRPVPPTAGPRAAGVVLESLPVVPEVPDLPAPPRVEVDPVAPPQVTVEPPPDPWRGPAGASDPLPPPRSPDAAPPARPTPPPDELPGPRMFDEVIPPDPPRPVPRFGGAPAEPAELPPAPPGFVTEGGTPVPGKHGTFGSAPVRLSRDYPSLAEVCGGSIREHLGLGREGGDPAAGHVYARAEYLMWWARGLNIPVLATTNPDPRRFGFLGEPGTVPLLGPDEFVGPFRQGVRLRGGLWFDNRAATGIDGSLFFLGRATADARFGSDQFPVITRPIFAPNTNPATGAVVGEFGEAVAVPGVLTGSLAATADSYLWGADANLRRCLFDRCDAKATVFVGYRFLGLTESLTVTENITVVGPGGARVALTDPVGTVVVVRDQFRTENYFNGGQVGGTWERRWGRFALDTRASVALGSTRQVLSISGAQTRTRPGAQPVTFAGGLLAAGPNLGTFTRDRFGVAPEFTLNAGYWLAPSAKVYVGYNFLYWSNVIRPGDQIDRVVDLTFVPNAPPVAFSGQSRPQPLFRQSDLWVTGLQFGLDLRW